ncbi:Uncharacterised protein [Ralstonia pickettii]|uniref:hypothetical protein n=1 Tax=Ralstonia TaxID=48736 RepID=UPI000504F327|nr:MULTISPECIES: hypothetical protein [Ralstonia]KFL21645.1 putative transmembrane protein [Ralstonia pickettii]MBU6521795.1 hypothetical protein [Ralstonia sp. B265]QQK34162.1 hypothetical protein RP6297_00345 [Ralstonia pickettii]UCA15475.1 hypothetical protein LA354_05640 [Ralstonia pickettii]SUE00702.1 Uncharacterised protein [Ralstonia pickettii]
MDYIDFARTWVVAHAEFLLTWLIAALVVILLAWIEIRRATRRAAIAMTEAVATTVAACVPEIAAAAQSAHPGVPASATSPGLAEAMRALGALAAERMHWLHAVANLRLPEAALPPAAPGMPVHQLVYDTPRPLAEAHLAAERRFADHARVLQAERRALQALETAEREGTSELHRIERETSAIVERFDQANAQSEQTDVQRFLIQKFNTLGNRERELTTQLAALRQQLGERTEALWAQSQRAADDYAAMLDPLLAVARCKLGHETATDETALWLARARAGQGPLRAV